MNKPPSTLAHDAVTVLEVAAVAFLSAVAGPLLVAGVVPVLDFCGRLGVDLGRVVGPLMMALPWVLPLVGGYWYGLKRQRRLAFACVLVGWGCGLTGSSSYLWVVLPALLHTRAGVGRHSNTSFDGVYAVIGWLAWLLFLAAAAILPTLVTMYGRRRRKRAL